MGFLGEDTAALNELSDSKGIKLLIFDLAGVCFNDMELEFLKQLSASYNIDADRLTKDYSALISKAETNRSSAEEVWKRLGEKYGFTINYKEILGKLPTLRELNKEMLSFIKRLRRGYKTAYLTNLSPDYAHHTQNHPNLDEYFDFGFYSYQINYRKPHPVGFRLLMTYFSVAPPETVFIDDSLKNLPPARKMGIHTVHFKSLEQAKRELGKLGVTENG